MILIGVDGLSHRFLEAHVQDLPFFRTMMKKNYNAIEIREDDALSAVMWNSVFAGIPPSQVPLRNYHIGDRMVKYDEIPFKKRYLWEKRKFTVISAPVVLPTYSNINLDLVNRGLTLEKEECEENMHRIFDAAMNYKDGDLIVCFTEIDRVEHFHWNKPELLETYKLLDDLLKQLLEGYKGNFIIFSDHGFRDIPEEGGILDVSTGITGDHDPVQIFMGTKRVEYTTDLYWMVLQGDLDDPKA